MILQWPGMGGKSTSLTPVANGKDETTYSWLWKAQMMGGKYLFPKAFNLLQAQL